MNLSHLRYFVQLSRTRHYARAAEQLHITQPSLSNAISLLEEELGVPLFERTGRRSVLTDCGQQFLESVERALAILDEGTEAMQRIARGEGLIRLGFLRTLGVDFVPDLAAGFLTAHPEQDIRFTFDSGPTPALLERLKQGQLDLVFSSPPPDRGSGLTAEVVGRQDLVLAVPRNHPLAGHGPIDLRDTELWEYILFSRSSGLRPVVDTLFQRAGFQPKIAYEVEEDQVIAGLVARGFGIAVVPQMEILERLPVAVLPIAAPVWERNFYMICDESRYVPPVVRNFQQHVRDSICPREVPRSGDEAT